MYKVYITPSPPPPIQGLTACYECQPKPTQKVYPICTIRSTPDKPVHCVVWAKELFKLLFGATSDSLLDEPLDGPDQSVTTEREYIYIETELFMIQIYVAYSNLGVSLYRHTWRRCWLFLVQRVNSRALRKLLLILKMQLSLFLTPRYDLSLIYL